MTSIGALRGQVAAASRQVALLERQLDDVPSRAEIAQYQKRFVELYNQGEWPLVVGGKPTLGISAAGNSASGEVIYVALKWAFLGSTSWCLE